MNRVAEILVSRRSRSSSNNNHSSHQYVSNNDRNLHEHAVEFRHKGATFFSVQANSGSKRSQVETRGVVMRKANAYRNGWHCLKCRSEQCTHCSRAKQTLHPSAPEYFAQGDDPGSLDEPEKAESRFLCPFIDLDRLTASQQDAVGCRSGCSDGSPTLPVIFVPPADGTCPDHAQSSWSEPLSGSQVCVHLLMFAPSSVIAHSFSAAAAAAAGHRVSYSLDSATTRTVSPLHSRGLHQDA